jgi:EmrB/QacA subfamily drug resistance transporter
MGTISTTGEKSMSTSAEGAVRAADPSSAPFDEHQHARRWLVLAVIGIAQLMVILDSSIVNIALPSAQRDLGFSNDARQWVVTAYALAFGSLLLLGGRFGDLFGRKRTFLVGVVGFAVASAVGGAANGFTMLVTARAVQGVFGALLAPAALSLLTTTFTDVKERGKAFGIYGAIAGAGGAIGLLLGGMLTQWLNWRYCMYVNIVFAVFAFIGGVAFLGSRGSTARPRLDLLGTVTISAGLFCVVYGFANAETHPWHSADVWVFLVVAAVLIAIFAWLQSRVEHPLLPLRIVLDRDRGGSYLSVFIIGVGMFGIFLFLTYYLQQNLGFSPITTGVAFLPMVAAVMLTATSATAVLLPKLGARPLIALGMLVAAGGMLWLAALNTSSTYAANVLPPLIVAGLGLGLAMAPAMNTATARVRPSDAGVASAMVNTMQQVGGSIGVALLSTIVSSAATSYVTAHATAAGVSKQVAVAATIHSYDVAFIWSAVIFAAGAIVCGLIVRPGRPVAEAAGVHDAMPL